MERILFLALLSGIQAQDIWGPSIVKGCERESLSVCCSYKEGYTLNEKYWCRGESFSSCRIVVTSSRQESGQTSLRDNRDTREFCVTIKDLTVQDSGAYWCAISVRGYDKHVAVAISVTAAQRPEGTGTLTILGISTGVLLLFLCLACVIATVWRRTGSRNELDGKGDSLKSFAEANEMHYAEVTVNNSNQPLSDFVTYGNVNCHTIAEDRSPEGSVEYAAVKY